MAARHPAKGPRAAHDGAGYDFTPRANRRRRWWNESGAAHQAGVSPAGLARQYGVNPVTIREWVRAGGGKVLRSGGRLPVDDALLVKLRNQGFTQPETGAIVDIKPNTVVVRLRRLVGEGPRI